MNRLLLVLTILLSCPAAWADEPAGDESVDGKHVVMHKNPGCGCCDLWADHLRTFGFTVESTEDPDILDFKAARNIPGPLMSCHTAVIDGYFVEGTCPRPISSDY